MGKTPLTLSLVVLASLVMGGAYAEQAPAESDGKITGYSDADLRHALGVMGAFVTFDADLHLVINDTAAVLHPEISRLDLAIVSDFAVHSNAIVDAMKTGPVGSIGELESDNPKLLAAINDMRYGGFEGFFKRGTSDVQNVYLGAEVSPVYPSSAVVPYISAFGIDVIPVYHGNYGPKCAFGLCATVCGGGLFDHHREPPEIPVGSFPSFDAAKRDLIARGYHEVPLPAVGHYELGKDHAKVSSAYGCYGGEFRDQAFIKSRSGSHYQNTQGPEVNPEVWTYVLPAPWWIAYVVIWHAQY